MVALERRRPDRMKYPDRLSDALYVLGRWNVRERGEQEPLWTPERPRLPDQLADGDAGARAPLAVVVDGAVGVERQPAGQL